MTVAEIQERVFRQSDRPQVALITNHGYAGVEIPIGGAPDTGGQIVYVNALAEALDASGHRVTIFARGGFPHFGGDRLRREPEYLSDHVRYVYVPGGGDAFIRKEDIAVALDEEVDWLDAFVRKEAAARDCPPHALYAFVSSHYWDGAVLGVRLVERWRNDVAAAAITELTSGSVPKEVVGRLKAERHRRSLGEAPAYHLGAVLLTSEGLPSQPLIRRAKAAAARWAEASWQASDGDAARIVAAVEKALTEARDRAAPPLHPLVAAEALGKAVLAVCSGHAERLERALAAADRHVWTPHSLAELKEENSRNLPAESCRGLKFCERRDHERMVCRRTRAFAATSTEIAERLRTHYRVPEERIFYFPPCVDRAVFRKYADGAAAAAYRYLADVCGVSVEALQSARIVFETSRMDQTKRKDLLLDAFVHVARAVKDVYLFIGGGPENELFTSLTTHRDAEAALRGRAFLTGFIPEEHIGPLFSIADVYASASEMEGFGMSVSQAAAAGTAVVSSDRVPFAVQYVPDDAMIVPAGDVEGLAGAILRLLQDDAARAARAGRLAEKVQALDWRAQTAAFVDFLARRGITGAAHQDPSH